MNNATIKLKVKQRLNKLASNDYDNLQDWHIIEAFNKALVSWSRRNIAGTNTKKIGDEGNTRRIEDFQVLLSELPMETIKRERFEESPLLPKDYMHFKRVHAKADLECDCDETHEMKVWLVEEGNVDDLLRDELKKPSFAWSETFCTLFNNQLRVYTNDEFKLKDVKLVYYRQPRKIEMAGVSNPYNTQEKSTKEVECEYKDDLVELIIDEAVKILASDLENVTVYQVASESVETNN